MAAKTTKAEALLNAHVNWLDAELSGDALRSAAGEWLDGLLADAKKVRLNDAVSPAAIHATIKKYAVELKLGGSIPVLVGDIARSVYDHKLHNSTTLEELLPDRVFTDLLDKLLELKSLRQALVSECVHNPVFAALITEVIARGIRDYAANTGKSAERLPGAKSALKLSKAMLAKTRPELGATLNNNLQSVVNKSAQSSLKASETFLQDAFEADEIRQVVLDLWAENKHHSVAALRDFIGILDVEELFVIYYEYWLHLRQTDFYSGMINQGVDTFFARFGEENLAALLAEIGITRAMMLDDVMRFVPPVVAAARKKKLLKPLLRRSLQGFYASPEAQHILRD